MRTIYRRQPRILKQERIFVKAKGSSEINRSGELNTIIGKGSKVQGNISVQNSLRIDGTITGNIQSTDTVIVGKEGRVKGEIKAKDILISGTVQGQILAENKVYLEAKAIIEGDMKASRLVVDEGATFDGNCSMKNNKGSGKVSGKETTASS
jgi:cytoskeletal protein CcmA (bactofilin family)